jgi:hypothetical protein
MPNPAPSHEINANLRRQAEGEMQAPCEPVEPYFNTLGM